MDKHPTFQRHPSPQPNLKNKKYTEGFKKRINLKITTQSCEPVSMIYNTRTGSNIKQPTPN